eukprot:744089-Rhodomonas_salina.1
MPVQFVPRILGIAFDLPLISLRVFVSRIALCKCRGWKESKKKWNQSGLSSEKRPELRLFSVGRAVLLVGTYASQYRRFRSDFVGAYTSQYHRFSSRIVAAYTLSVPATP